MKDVELYARVRYAVQVEGLSERAAARRFGIDPRTVAKIMRFSVPPGYRRTKPPVKPKLGAFIAIIDGILAADKRRPKKQQHTAKRIFERLRDEHGFTGGITIVKEYVAGCGRAELLWRWPVLQTMCRNWTRSVSRIGANGEGRKLGRIGAHGHEHP